MLTIWEFFNGLWKAFERRGVAFLHELTTLDIHVILLVFLIVVTVIVVDGARLVARRRRQESGIGVAAQPRRIEGSKSIPGQDYISDIQGLSGRPDALVVEDGFFIPVEVKPLAKKLRDRYVAQLLVYMRLVEEFEGKRPPHGYLILGPNNRRIKIKNTDERQQWLQLLLDQMRAVLEGNASPLPEPHPRKCQPCRVRELCRIYRDTASEG